MPAVAEFLSSQNVALPIRNALLPNFYRSAAFSAGSKGGSRGENGELISADESLLADEAWSDDEPDLDEEEHRETQEMLLELTRLSVPGLKQHHSSNSESLENRQPSPTDSSNSSGNRNPQSSGNSQRAGAIVSSSGAVIPPRPTPRQHRAHVTAVDTVFHNFYAKRCIHSVKKSMASSGMLMTFRDMFEKLDPTRSGVIQRSDWSNLLMKLNLPVDSATSLSRIVGVAETPTINLEQFAMHLALCLHGPYVRMLQSRQNHKRTEVFLGGDKQSSATWRKEAVQQFKKSSVPFFNPIPEESSEDQQEGAEGLILEALAKTQCQMMLFVVDGRTRSIASMVEASEHMTSQKEVLMVMQDVAAGLEIAGEVLTAPEAKDLNRGRAYLADVAHRNAHSGVTVFKTVEAACDYIAKRTSGAIVRPNLKAFTKPVVALPTATIPPSPSVSSLPAHGVKSSISDIPPLAVSPSNAGANTSATANSPAPIEENGGAASPTPPVVAVTTEAPPVSVSPPPASSAAHPMGSPRSLQLQSARRHSTGITGVRSGGGRESVIANGTGGLSPVVSSPTASSSSFPLSDWPAHPHPSDFDRYLASGHFGECARIVFKHQGLLSRRAAVKLAAATPSSASDSPQSALISNATATSGVPPGLFRMASSPFSASSRMKNSGSLSSLMQLQQANLTDGLSNERPFAVPTRGSGPLHVITDSPGVSPVADTTGVVAAAVPASSSPTSATATTTFHRQPSPGMEASRSSSEQSSILSQNRVSVRMVNGEDAQSGERPQLQAYSSVSAAERSGVSRPTTSPSTMLGVATLSTSSSQSKLLDPFTAAGVSVTVPESTTHSSHHAISSSSPDESVLTTHLFTMLIRLHEIIQLSTGITFLHPYPQLVQAELDQYTQLADSETLKQPQWIHLAKRIFGKLRGIHEADPNGTASTPTAATTAAAMATETASKTSSTTSPTSNKDSRPPASKSPPFTTGGDEGKEHLIVPGSSSPIIHHSLSTPKISASTPIGSPIAGGFPLASPTGSPLSDGFSRRRSLTGALGLSTQLTTNAAPASSSALGAGISPSQFLRGLTLGQNRRASGTPVAEGDASPNGEMISVNAPSAASTNYHASSRATGQGAQSAIGLSASRASPDLRPRENHSAPMDPLPSVTSKPVPDPIPSPGTAASKHKLPLTDRSPAPSNSAAIMQRVQSRISAQRKVIESMTALSNGPGAAGKKNVMDEANTLSPDDLSKLSASVSASLAHDQLLLKEMLPSFQSMYAAIDTKKKGVISMEGVADLLAVKLLLPQQSCDSLMSVLNVALESCQQEAALNEKSTKSRPPTGIAGEKDNTDSPVDPSSLPLSAFNRTSLTYPAFCGILSKTLHLQSSPFSSFLDSRSFQATSRRVCSQVFLGGQYISRLHVTYLKVSADVFFF